MNEKDVTRLDIENLQKLYQKELDILNASLLNGFSWEALKDQRWKVTHLSVLVHKNLTSENNDPSSFNSRGENR
jgi:hypothetical protein